MCAKWKPFIILLNKWKNINVFKTSNLSLVGYNYISLTFMKALSQCVYLLWLSFSFLASWLCSLISSQWSLDFFGDLREGDSLLSIPLSCVVCQWAHQNCHSQDAPEHEPVRHLKCHCSLTDNLIENPKIALTHHKTRILVISFMFYNNASTFPILVAILVCFIFLSFCIFCTTATHKKSVGTKLSCWSQHGNFFGVWLVYE